MTYLGLSWLALYPILVTAVVADDYLNPFYQFEQAGFSPVDIARYAYNGTKNAGHFNYVGQLFGGYTVAATMWLVGSVGVRYSTVFAVTKFIVYVVSALVASGFLREALRILATEVSPWRCRAVVSALLFGSLQLHVGWSNDPVASYPLAGFGAAALGFFVLTLSLRALRDRRYIWPAAFGATLAILYYELNVAVVVAFLVPVGWALMEARRRGQSVAREGFRWLPMLALPTVVSVALQLHASRASANYGGTSISRDLGELFATYWRAVVGSLPGASWRLSGEWLGSGGIHLQAKPVLLWLLFGTLGLLFLGQLLGRAGTGRMRPIVAVMAVAAVPLAYWLVATLVQSSTAKVQDELKGIGYVYTFYAVGAMALAVAGALVVFLVPWRRLPPAVRVASLVGLSTYLAVQLIVNWSVSERLNAATEPNQALLVAFSERADPEARCTALRNWTAGAWPLYYEFGMVSGLDHAYREFVGEEFCPGFVYEG